MAAPDATCGKCDGAYFENIYKVKRISAAISPNGQEMIIPAQVFQCNKCGYVNDQFKPS